LSLLITKIKVTERQFVRILLDFYLKSDEGFPPCLNNSYGRLYYVF
jgi:hypothetical protein